MRGRKPRPTASKLLEGNPGKRPLNDAEPQHPVPDASFDDVPLELKQDPVAGAEWRRLVPLLRRARQITEADRAALIALCLQWALYLDAQQRVKNLGPVIKAPSGYPMLNPYLSVANKSLAACNRLWPELGLTPSSRSRVKMDGDGDQGGEFAEFLDDAPAADTRH